MRFMVAAVAALLAELFGPAFNGVVHAGPSQGVVVVTQAPTDSGK